MQAGRTPFAALPIIIANVPASIPTFGGRLKHARKNNPNRGMRTLVAVSGYVGISHSAISQWESDRIVPELENLIRFAEVCNVSIDWLVRGGEMSSGIESRIRKVHPVLRAGLVERIHQEIDSTIEAEKRLPAEMLVAGAVKDTDKRLAAWSARGKLPPHKDN